MPTTLANLVSWWWQGFYLTSAALGRSPTPSKVGHLALPGNRSWYSLPSPVQLLADFHNDVDIMILWARGVELAFFVCNFGDEA